MNKNLSFLACIATDFDVESPRTPSMTGLLNGSVAQLVEQRIENPRVGGSIPSRAIYFFTLFHTLALSIGA